MSRRHVINMKPVMYGNNRINIDTINNLFPLTIYPQENPTLVDPHLKQTKDINRYISEVDVHYLWRLKHSFYLNLLPSFILTFMFIFSHIYNHGWVNN